MSPTTYPSRELGANGPIVSAIGLGVMGMGVWYGKPNEDECFETLTYAADRGITFWDTADVYGTSEALLGKWFKTTGRRSEIFLATKFGAMNLESDTQRTSPCSRPSYIRRRIEASLKALQTEYIDLYYQHRIDPEVPIEVVMGVLGELVKEGKIKYIGLSNCSIDVLRRAKAVPEAGERLIACQMEYSPFELTIETSGFLSAARKLGVAIVPYSPLGRGMITGQYKSLQDFAEDDIRRIMPRFSESNFPKNLELVNKFKTIGDRLNITPGQVALAWMITENPDFFPIPGTRSIERLEENAKAAEIALSSEIVEEIRATVEAADVQGAAVPEAYSSFMTSDCIAMSQWKGE